MSKKSNIPLELALPFLAGYTRGYEAKEGHDMVVASLDAVLDYFEVTEGINPVTGFEIHPRENKTERKDK